MCLAISEASRIRYGADAGHAYVGGAYITDQTGADMAFATMIRGHRMTHMTRRILTSPPRDAWSDWDKPGEQAHWCRGGICYPTYRCDHFKKFMGKRFEPCIRCDTVVYQDGHRYCPLVEVIGCEACYESMMEGLEDKEIERC